MGKIAPWVQRDENEIQPVAKGYEHDHTTWQVLIPNLVRQDRQNFAEKAENQSITVAR